jgi:hypothetical protein
MSERTPSSLVAERSHERMTSSNSATPKATHANAIRRLFIIGFEVINVEDTKLEGTHNKTSGVDARRTFREELLDKFVLALL